MGCSLSYLATPLTPFLDDHSGGDEERRIVGVQLPHPPWDSPWPSARVWSVEQDAKVEDFQKGSFQWAEM